AYSHYGQSEYLIASSLFKSFWLSFPRSYRAEECLYMSAFCLYTASPRYELDQTYAEKALEALQFFIDTYDNSDRIPKCNEIMDELRKRLEQKMYAGAELYFNMENYQAAAVTYENLLQDFPETSEAEYINLLIIRAYFNYAGQSTICKKTERYDKAIKSYSGFKDRFPGSEYLDEAEGLYNRSVDLKAKAFKEQQNYNCNE
ncbi:MAG: outer membrane protein assembly factor BamD, partial [Chitinophagales bacterium]|nr:outer membrane protein assembly factor BamD [Chitinophagales bacterium]